MLSLSKRGKVAIVACLGFLSLDQLGINSAQDDPNTNYGHYDTASPVHAVEPNEPI